MVTILICIGLAVIVWLLLVEKTREKANKVIEESDEDCGFEYSHTIDPDEWTVYEVK